MYFLLLLNIIVKPQNDKGPYTNYVSCFGSFYSVGSNTSFEVNNYITRLTILGQRVRFIAIVLYLFNVLYCLLKLRQGASILGGLISEPATW